MKTLKITPFYRWSYEDCDKEYFTGDIKTYEKYIKGVFINNRNFSGLGFEEDEIKESFTIDDDMPYFEWLEVDYDLEVVNYELKVYWWNREFDVDYEAKRIVENYLYSFSIGATGYSQGDYQEWTFVFKKPKSKKDLEKLKEIEKRLNDLLSKMFTASDFNFNATIEEEKEDELNIKYIDDFDDLYIYSDDMWINENDEELKQKIEEVKNKYGVDKVEFEEVVYK